MVLCEDSAPDVPCIMCGSQCLPLNGIQANVDDLLDGHSDISDMENSPTATLHFGEPAKPVLEEDPENKPRVTQEIITGD